jgi:hypothetical protein
MTFPAAPAAGNAGASGAVDADPAVRVDVAAEAEAEQENVVRGEAGRHEQHLTGNDTAVVHLDAAQLVGVVDDELFDVALDDADGAGEQRGPRGGAERIGWGEVAAARRPRQRRQTGVSLTP